MTKPELLKAIREYIKVSIFDNHLKNSLSKNTRLKSYKINPIVSKYLSKILLDEYSPEGLAKALYYPRVLGTSINTSFGTRIQDMFIELGLAEGADIKKLDIIFIDKTDGRKKWCQLKAGPNTINAGDVKPLMDKFDSFVALSRGNKANREMTNNDLILGVLYGETKELSQHYLKIDERYPVIIGQDFWYRITGFEDFYSELVVEIDDLIFNFKADGFFEKGLKILTEEIRESDQFDFKADSKN